MAVKPLILEGKSINIAVVRRVGKALAGRGGAAIVSETAFSAPVEAPLHVSPRTLAITLFLPALALASAPEFLVRNGDICDPDRTMCIRGSLVYLPDSRIMELTGRVAGSPGPGWVRILFKGNWRGHLASSVMEIPIRGTNSEIVQHKYIPDNPAVRYWRILTISFEPDDAAARAAADR